MSDAQNIEATLARLRDRRDRKAALGEMAPELLKVAQAAMEYIDALPKDLILPAMPGFDRDWADDTISAAEALL